MTANKYTRERKSLCEESMLVLVNIIKLSSLSLARNGLPKTPCDTTPNTKRSGYNKKSISGGIRPSSSDDNNTGSDVDGGVSRGNRRSKRAQKPEQGGSNVSYLMLPSTIEGDQQHETSGGSWTRPTTTASHPSYVHEVRDGEGKFSDYIRRFHEKTENDLRNAIVEGKAEEYIKKFHEKNKKDTNNDSKRLSYVLPPPPLSDHHQQHHHVKSRSFA